MSLLGECDADQEVFFKQNCCKLVSQNKNTIVYLLAIWRKDTWTICLFIVLLKK